MEKHSNLLIKLGRRLFNNSTEQEKFIEALIHPSLFIPAFFGVRISQLFCHLLLSQLLSGNHLLLTAYLREKNLVSIHCMNRVISTVSTSLLSLLLLPC